LKPFSAGSIPHAEVKVTASVVSFRIHTGRTSSATEETNGSIAGATTRSTEGLARRSQS
jgi:hypothetical protein